MAIKNDHQSYHTDPLAIAPTNTAIECVSGNVGRYFDNLTVCASPESAGRRNVSLGYVGLGLRLLTDFVGISGEMVCNRVLDGGLIKHT